MVFSTYLNTGIHRDKPVFNDAMFAAYKMQDARCNIVSCSEIKSVVDETKRGVQPDTRVRKEGLRRVGR